MPTECITNGEGDEQEVIDTIITVVVTTVIDMHPEEQGDMRSLRTIISVRMSLDEGLGYLGGQRLAHERPYLLLPALDQYANASWYAMRRSHFDRGQYRSGFIAGFIDELDGTAHRLPEELPVLSR